METKKRKPLIVNKGQLSSSQKLKVLAYHGVSDVRNFERQMIFLKEYYDVISIDRLFAFFTAGSDLPKKPLLITFDDGDYSLYKNAYPVLKALNIPATVFVITQLLNTNRAFWWDEIMYYLGEKEGGKKVWEVKEWKNQDRLNFLSSIRKDSSKVLFSSRQLNSSEVIEMHKAGITIANHSHSHPMFNQCSGPEIKDEIETSTEVLKSLGLEIRAFAYPNGNFSEMAENILLEHQFSTAFLFDHKINRGEIHPLRISRLVVNDSTPMWKLKFILSGCHSRILPLTRRLGKILK